MSRFRVRVGLVLEYDVDAADAVEIRRHIDAVRAEDGVDVDGEGVVWAGPDVISIELVDYAPVEAVA